MGIIKNIRSVLPIPRAWEQDSDRRNFALRVETALRELFSRRVAKIRMNGNELATDDHDVADLGDVAKAIFLTSADSTWEKVWSKINVLKNGETACLVANNLATYAFSNQTRNNTVYGTISRSTASTFQINASNANLLQFVMRLTNCDSSGCDYSESAIPRMKQVTAPEGANNFTVSNNSRIFIDFVTSASARMGRAQIYSSASGALTIRSDLGSKIALSTSTNTLTVTCTDGPTALYCTVMRAILH